MGLLFVPSCLSVCFLSRVASKFESEIDLHPDNQLLMQDERFLVEAANSMSLIVRLEDFKGKVRHIKQALLRSDIDLIWELM